MTVKLVYFAWVRERIGLSEEEVELPDTVSTGAELISFLSQRGEGYSHALENPQSIRIAIDKELMASLHDDLGTPAEIALFPPMTGG